MTANQTQTTISLSPADLETIIRRVMREELRRLFYTPVRSVIEDWKHEGPDDLAGDDLLLVEALAVLQQYGDTPDSWVSWEEFETELDEAEAVGELSH